MAGKGSRLRPHTLTVPKPLIAVAGKPIVQRLVEDLSRSYDGHIEEVVFIIGDFEESVRLDLMKVADSIGAKGTIYQQHVPLGIAHAILCAADSLDGNCIVAFADTLFKANFSFDINEDGIIWVQKVDNPSSFGVVKVNEDNIITDFVEKPATFVSDLAIVGIYYFKDGAYLKSQLQHLIDNEIREKGEFQLTSALENMKQQGLRFKTSSIDEWLDCGNKDNLVYANQRVLELNKDKRLIAGSVTIENSVIIPPCYISDKTVIKNSIIGPYVSIGNNSSIEDSVINNSVIQDHTFIKDANLNNSMIGSHVEYEGKKSELSISDYSKYVSVILLLLLPLFTFAQPVRISEKAIYHQEVFMDAYGKKLMGKTDSAKALFLRLVEEDNTDDAAFYQLADLSRVDENMDQAINYIRKAVLLAPENKWYKLFLAEVYEYSGKDKEAALLYEQLATTQAFDQTLYFRWAYFLLRAEEPSKALKVYDDLEKRIGLNEEIIRHKHTVYLALGDLKKAEKELVRLVNAFPDKVDYYRMLAGFYEQQNNKEQAILVYQKILALDPNDAKANVALLNNQKQGGDESNYLNALRPLFQKPEIAIDDKIKEIVPYLEKLAGNGDIALGNQLLELARIIQQVHPEEAKSYALSGDLLYHTGKKEAALEQYEAALGKNKNIYAVWEQIMYIYRESDRFEELLNITEEVMDRFPNQPSVFFLQGVAFNQLKKYADAGPPLEQALIMTSKDPLLRIETLFELATASYQQADYTRAKTWLEKALETSQNSHPPSLAFYGDVLFQLGDESNALKYWQLARDKGDKSPELLRKISEKKL